MFIVIYRPHGTFQCLTKYYGPYETHDEAYNYLCTLPAIGPNNDGLFPGCKHIEQFEEKK